MRKQKKRVAVLFGGKGAEHDISLASGSFVLKLLSTDDFDPLPILIDRSGDWLLTENKKLRPVSPCRKNGAGGILKGRRFIRLDAAFPVLHGDFGEDGKVQGLLEMLDIPFVGCDTLSGAACSDKGFAKAIAASVGVPTLPWLSSSGKTNECFRLECEEKLGLPLFVKPSGLGSSVGAGIAESSDELAACIRLAKEVGGGRIIAEKYLKNPRELECAFLSLGGKKYITAPGEITLSSGFYSYSEKYKNTSSAQVSPSADLSPELAEKIYIYTKKITDVLCVKGLSRVDFFLSGEKLYFNEINTMPGMTEASLYPRLAERIGISNSMLINGLVKDVLQ